MFQTSLSDTGRDRRDAFLSLTKTRAKLRIAFLGLPRRAACHAKPAGGLILTAPLRSG
jgi:hypothetical protein